LERQLHSFTESTYAEVGGATRVQERGALLATTRRPVARPSGSWPLACLATDAIMLTAAAIVVQLGPLRDVPPHAPLAWVAPLSAIVLALLALRGAYEQRLRLTLLDDLRGVMSATAVAAMAVITARVVLVDQAAALQTVWFWLFATGFVAMGRIGLVRAETSARRRGDVGQPTLIIGAGMVGHLAARRLLQQPELGLNPVGFLDKDPMEVDDPHAPPVLGASWDLEHVIADYGIERVIVTFSTAPHSVLLAMARRCWELGVTVSLVPRLFEIEGERVTAEHLGALPLVTVSAANPKGWQFRVKYAIDRVLGTIGFLLTLPLFAALALAVRITMGTPVLYRQPRVGHDGHQFDMLKFRTMSGSAAQAGEADSDWALEQLSTGGAGSLAAARPSGSWEEKDDPAADDRRTPLGRFLRRFSLDELPQLLNVMRGDMSLVGPRPERVAYARRFEEAVYRYGARHRVKSGITGWAQIHDLRGRTSLADRVEWDNYYIENWSLWMDVKILLKTVTCIINGHEEK
jgi:exopolysaccharide biosynthesis polyprenyl glycosylphosphotransferase